MNGTLSHSTILPSWIPNPTAWTDTVPQPLSLLAASMFVACTDSSPYAKISDNGRSLYLDVALVGTVEYVGHSFDDLIEFTEFIRS